MICNDCSNIMLKGTIHIVDELDANNKNWNFDSIETQL